MTGEQRQCSLVDCPKLLCGLHTEQRPWCWPVEEVGGRRGVKARGTLGILEVCPAVLMGCEFLSVCLLHTDAE